MNMKQKAAKIANHVANDDSRSLSVGCNADMLNR